MFRMDNRIVELASHELDLHPEARLDDLYKLFYQGTFGPKHLMEDQAVALRYLAEEIDCEEFDQVLWQDVSYMENFFRLNLVLVKNRQVLIDDLFRALVASSRVGASMTREDWKLEWQRIEAVLRDSLPESVFTPESTISVKEALESGRLLHHSSYYKRSYHPHYRVISREWFERLIGTTY
ncbi:hypothetical protein DS66_00235 [Mesotoga sp. SC_3PWM13N19]|uniref:hypothetical protein n=2 Tax=Mesotoga TaxID=1184396 RepID=UPI000DBF7D4F|nr:hypothetical protein [Mesotoga sp. UBA5847]RAM60241.1 hypothetical protein DS66_00235 [Mesotoga sp. SC_3PWM13N19]